MGEILGVGISHSPLFGMPPDEMSGALRARLNDPKLPAAMKDPANWPAKMCAEWSDDFGAAAGARHQADMLADFRKVRAALDEFAPDFIVIWGDDQYENFREQIIPPFCILAFDEVIGKPWASAPDSRRGFRANVWNEGPDAEIRVKCHREAAKYIASALLEQEFDMSYAYEPRFHKGLSHAFLNAVMYLDYERKGFPHRIVPVAAIAMAVRSSPDRDCSRSPKARPPRRIRRRPARIVASRWARRSRASAATARGASR